MTAIQYLAPGWGYINETGTQQFLLPGMGYLDSTSTTSAAFSMAGNSSASFSGVQAVQGSFSAVGQSSVSFTSGLSGQGTFSSAGSSGVSFSGQARDSGSFSISAPAAVSFSGLLKAVLRSFMIPGWGYVNQQAIRQYLIPGMGYLNETPITLSTFSAAGSASASFGGGRIQGSQFSGAGTVAAAFGGTYKQASGFGIAGSSFALFSAVSRTQFTIGGNTSPDFRGASTFYTLISYFNMDDSCNYVSFVPFNTTQAIAVSHGFAAVSFGGSGLLSGSFSMAGQAAASFSGQTAGGGWSLDFSQPKNSMYL